jgi:hypothetical protein
MSAKMTKPFSTMTTFERQQANEIHELRQQRDECIAALKAMQKAFNQLLPGIGNIACQDYKNINEAPILAARAIAMLTERAKP